MEQFRLCRFLMIFVESSNAHAMTIKLHRRSFGVYHDFDCNGCTMCNLRVVGWQLASCSEAGLSSHLHILSCCNLHILQKLERIIASGLGGGVSKGERWLRQPRDMT